MKTFMVASDEDALGLLLELTVQSEFDGMPVGFDLETTGCDPNKESPIGKAKIWCATFAWGKPADRPPSPFRRAFVPREYVQHLKPWLENERYLKVGANLHGYDRHACANEGIELRGIEGCVSAMSRLLDPSKGRGHSNKALGAELGYKTVEYSDLSLVCQPGPSTFVREYLCAKCSFVTRRKSKKCPDCKYLLTTFETESQNIKWAHKQLDELWAEHPEKREAIVEYACTDPCMSLDAYWVLRRKLEGVRW